MATAKRFRAMDSDNNLFIGDFHGLECSALALDLAS